MVLVSSEYDDKCFQPALNQSPFQFMVDDIFDIHSVPERGKYRPSQTALHKTESGEWERGRVKLPYVLLTFYNLEYDLSRLFNHDSPFFNLIRLNIEGTHCIVDGYDIEMVHIVPTGSAPHFTIILRKDGRILKLYAIDLWGYLKNGLGVSAKALGIIDKLPVDKSYFHIPLEQLTESQLDELRTYAVRDAKVTRQLYITLLNFLVQFSPDVITKKGILPPSAPAAAARIAFSKMEKDILHQSPAWAVQLALESYNGGLVFSRVRGYVENILVGDRNSAYPTMLKLLPNPESVTYTIRYKPSIDELIGKIGFCRADFTIINTTIPFITSHAVNRSNHAPGLYKSQPISIYELAAGYLVGAITNISIRESIYLSYSDDAIGTGFLSEFVDYFHKVKNESKPRPEEGILGNPALYMLAKLMMNSLYGKLIEMRDPQTHIVPRHIRFLRVPSYWRELLDRDKAFKKRFSNSILNQGEDMDELISDFPPNADSIFISIDHLLSDSTITAGTYFLPFYASLVTAGQRAWMSVYTYFTNAVLADTDSAFTSLSITDFQTALTQADAITQKIGVGRCQIGKELGDIDIELSNANGYIAGIKQYALQSSTKQKIAHHTIVPCLDNDEEHPREFRNLFYSWVIRSLASGRSVSYQTKSSPVRMKTALQRGRDFGLFESGVRLVSPKDDPRMKKVVEYPELVYYEWVGR